MDRSDAPSIVPALLACALLTLTGCYCPEVKDQERYAEYDLSTPERALEYFQAALERGDEDLQHQYLVISEEMKENVERKQNQKLSFSNFVLVRDRIRSYLEERIGAIEDIEVDDAVFQGSDRARCKVTSGSHEATIEMVREVSYLVYFTDGTDADGRLPPGRSPVRMTRRELMLRLPLGTASGAGDDREPYRISYYREWKIAGVVGGTLVKEIAEDLEKGRQGGAEKKPDA